MVTVVDKTATEINKVAIDLQDIQEASAQLASETSDLTELTET